MSTVQLVERINAWFKDLDEPMLQALHTLMYGYAAPLKAASNAAQNVTAKGMQFDLSTLDARADRVEEQGGLPLTEVLRNNEEWLDSLQ